MKTWTPGQAPPGVERPMYLDRAGEQIYTVQHAAAGPRRASVILAGPMTLERSHGYLTWARFARQLAANGYDAWRFDYRGVGESTGDFRQQTFDSWHDDLRAVIEHVRGQGSGRLVVVGLRLGALLGRRVFEGPDTDALIAWDPPVGGKTMLMEMLRRKLAADYMEGGRKKTREDYVRDLERGQFVEVEGYHWSRGLWSSAEAWAFTEPRRLDGNWMVTYLDGRSPDRLPAGPNYTAVRIPRPAFWLQSLNLVADLSALFEVTLTRLDTWSRAWSKPGVAERAS